jgi:predicted nuclease of predicted toxin-antitoxin system
LGRILKDAGYDAVRTRNLLGQNTTQDAEINLISIAQERIVITGNRDFLASFLICQQPWEILCLFMSNYLYNQPCKKLEIS